MKTRLTTTEAAQRLGMSRKRVERLCRQGRVLGAERFGNRWALPVHFKITPARFGSALRVNKERLMQKNGEQFPSACERCGATDKGMTMSRFNTDWLCPACEDKEKAHPLYSKAYEAELAAVRRGDYNFPGIGKPHDL